MKTRSNALRVLFASSGLAVLLGCSSGSQSLEIQDEERGAIASVSSPLLACIDAAESVPAGAWQCGESRALECTSPSGAKAPPLTVRPREPAISSGSPLTCADVSLQSNAPSGGVYSLGAHEVIVSQTAPNASKTEVCRASLTVKDTKAPVVAARDQAMWPPNHKMSRIAIADCVQAFDACDPKVRVFFTAVTSDEPVDAKGDGRSEPDVAASCASVDLRRERQGGADGRVYRLFWRAIDASGNAADGSCRASVPHDQSGREAIEGAAAYRVDVATTACH